MADLSRNDEPNQAGDFIWYELMTSDVSKAEEFYGPMLGWTFADGGNSDMGYRIASANGANVAGLMPISEQMKQGGARPAWVGYIMVDAINDALAMLDSLSGKRFTEAMSIEGVGHFAMVSDPQGAPFYLIQPEGDGPSPSFSRYAPQDGHCAWNELATEDQAGAARFYTALFGWNKVETMDMGAMGAYDMYRTADYMLGAIMQKPAEMPVSLWSYYFRAADIDEAAAYVAANGGKLIVEPMEIPGGEYVLTGLDPQGAMFSLIGKKGV